MSGDRGVVGGQEAKAAWGSRATGWRVVISGSGRWWRRREERRRKVQRAVTERLGFHPPSQFRVMVMTFAQAPGILTCYVREGVAEPVRPRRERVVKVDEALLEQVRDGYNAMAETLNAHRQVITEHN